MKLKFAASRRAARVFQNNMMRTILLLVLAATTDAVVELIIDTDLGFDVDDAGAIAVANHLQDLGLCELRGVVHNTGFVEGIGAVDSIMNYYGRGNDTRAYGAYKGAWASSDDAQAAQDRYATAMSERWPSRVAGAGDVGGAADAYGRLLAASTNGSVVIASIGEPTALRDALQAHKDLFAAKVKQIVYMDLGYNFGCGDAAGSDWSPWLGSTDGCAGAAKYVVDHMPASVQQVFSPAGEDVLTGSRFHDGDGCGAGPAKFAYETWTNYGSRPSWDLIATYYAVAGLESLYSTATRGTNAVDAAGNENFVADPAGPHLRVDIDPAHDGDVVRLLDDALCAAPCRGDCAGYEYRAMANCYDGHGATNLESPPDASAGAMTLAACLALCDATAACEAAGVRASGDGGLVDCYRKADVDLGACDAYYPFATWTKRA